MNKVYIISLGCEKNRVDKENVLYYLINAGYQITDNQTEAEIVIINTCAFIKSAEKESIDEIFKAASLKSGNLKKLVVTGCLTERYGKKLQELLPEVDIFLGSADYGKIVELIEKEKAFCNDKTDVPTTSRILSTPQHYAYLKISEGCDNHCTYCTIPSIRGAFRSRTIESLVEETLLLEKSGASELILVGQDVTAYGKDLYGKPSLELLIKNLLEKTTIEKFRLMYCYPELVSDELIALIASEKRIANYIDIPLQHISSSVLRRMGRKSNKKSIELLFDKLNAKKIKVRTTFMVGFPGETEEEFNELTEFVKKYKPLNAGIFAYSKEAGTPAARMMGQVAQPVKRKRVSILGKIIKENAHEFNSKLIGTVVETVYEDIDYDRQLFVGRADWAAPDVDGLVYFKGDYCDVGTTYPVKITSAKDYDLYGEVVK